MVAGRPLSNADASGCRTARIRCGKCAAAERSFDLLPRRWMVERSLVRAAHFRRLVKDDERYASAADKPAPHCLRQHHAQTDCFKFISASRCPATRSLETIIVSDSNDSIFIMTLYQAKFIPFHGKILLIPRTTAVEIACNIQGTRTDQDPFILPKMQKYFWILFCQGRKRIDGTHIGLYGLIREDKTPSE